MSAPLGVLGNPTTKSMAMSSHFHSGMRLGWSNHPGRWCSALICWQVRHSATNRAIPDFILGHQYLSLRSRYILVSPGWQEYVVWCFSLRIVFLSSWSGGMYTLFIKVRRPSGLMEKFGSDWDWNLFWIFWNRWSKVWTPLVVELGAGWCTRADIDLRMRAFAIALALPGW